MSHVVTIVTPDSAGHWAWNCPCGSDGSGYETSTEVLDAATAHGPIAADSPLPCRTCDGYGEIDCEDCDDAPASGCETCGDMGTYVCTDCENGIAA